MDRGHPYHGEHQSACKLELQMRKPCGCKDVNAVVMSIHPSAGRHDKLRKPCSRMHACPIMVTINTCKTRCKTQEARPCRGKHHYLQSNMLDSESFALSWHTFRYLQNKWQDLMSFEQKKKHATIYKLKYVAAQQEPVLQQRCKAADITELCHD